MIQEPDRNIAPAIGVFQQRSLPVPAERRLDNGIVRRCLHRSDYKLVKISIVCPTGSMEYKPDVARLRGMMLKEGSTHYSGAVIAESLDFNGASTLSQPVNHYNITSLTALRRNIDKVLPLFFDMMLNPEFPDKELEALKRQSVSELRCNFETPSYHAAAEAKCMQAGSGHRFAARLTVEGIESIDRALLAECQARSIDPQHIQAYIAGCADNDLLHQIDGYLSAISPVEPFVHDNIVPFCPEPAGICRVEVPGSLQNAIVSGIPVPGYGHEAYWPLRLAAHALGGYFGSRLMQNIREDKGYTYGIGASLTNLVEGSYLSISCECDGSYTDAVIEEIGREIRRFATEPMGHDEHRRMQLSIASQLAGICDTPMKVQSQLISRQVQGVGDNFYDEFWQALYSVTPQMMTDAVARYLPVDAQRIVIAGDFKK